MADKGNKGKNVDNGWIGGLLQRESMPVLEASMAMAHRRQLLISNNIANVETPHYQRQGLPDGRFLSQLRRACRDREDRHWNDFAPGGDFSVRWRGNYATGRTLEPEDRGPLRHDENNVNLEQEMGDLAKNTMFMTALQRLYKSQAQLWHSALRDRVA